MRIKFRYRLAIFLLNIISKTWRYKIEGTLPNSNGIVAFWHGYMLPVWRYFSKYNPFAVVSQSRDGELLSELLSSWGYSLIRGSSSKGSKEALDEITHKASDKIILMTPDGPRGPIYEFKPGAAVASMRAGVTLYLCKVRISWKINFKKSWDNFSLPLPFSKIYINILCIEKINDDSSRDEVDEKIKYCTEFLNS